MLADTIDRRVMRHIHYAKDLVLSVPRKISDVIFSVADLNFMTYNEVHDSQPNETAGDKICKMCGVPIHECRRICSRCSIFLFRGPTLNDRFLAWWARWGYDAKGYPQPFELKYEQIKLILPELHFIIGRYQNGLCLNSPKGKVLSISDVNRALLKKTSLVIYCDRKQHGIKEYFYDQ